MEEEEEKEARGVVARVVESGWRRGWLGRPPKRRRRTESDHASVGRGLCVSDPIDVVDGVICVGNGIASRANLEKETNVWKDAVGFREGLANGVGISGEVRGIFRGSINLNLAAEEEEVEVKEGVTCNGDFSEISEGLGINGFGLNSVVDLNEGLDMEDECGERFDFLDPLAKRSEIDLNLEAAIDLDENVGIDGQGGVIDLNLGPNCEAEHGGNQGKIQESVLAPLAISDCGKGNVSCKEEKFVDVNVKYGKLKEVQCEDNEPYGVSVCSSVDVCQDKDCGSINALGCDVMGDVPLRTVKVVEGFDSSVLQEDKSKKPGEFNKSTPGNFETPYTLGSGCRKRRKYLDKVNTSEMVLRRSARRGSLKCYDSNPATASVSCYVASSPAVSALTEEQPEDPILLPPKFPLPPSSQKINLEGLPVMDIFSVYAFLRSFSIFLFLSPFELEDFVFALKLESPNSLVDNIHVSLLMTLRRHLEFLSKEGSLSALSCLWSLNWDLLDHKTWLMFLSEYILLHGSRPQGSFELHSVNLLKVGYYRQPVTLKIEILRSLCDEVIEMEAVRSELVRRCSVGDTDVEFVRTAKTNKKKKRTRSTEPLDRAEEAIGERCDWNSDECCLCKMEGVLICCDGCPAAYHPRCLGIVANLLPEGEWYCPECAIDRDHRGMKPGRSLRGAELLGIDVHGRLYFSCLSYLLVSDSSDAEFRYYHEDDLNQIFEAFKPSESLFAEISRAIHSKWGAYFSMGGANVTFMENNRRIVTPLDHSTMSYYTASEIVDKTRDLNQSKQEYVFEGSACPDSEALNSQQRLVTEMSVLRASPEGSFDTTLTSSDMQKNELGHFDEYKLKEDTSVEQKTFYVNFYYFGRTAASVADELIGEFSSNKLKEDPEGSEEETIFTQMKVISTKCSKFYWPDYTNMDIQKESCGWCFSCRTSSTDLDCLFKTHMDSVPNCDTDYMVGSLFSKMNKKDLLMDVLCCILFFEERLHGLLCGPWLSSSYRTMWRQNALKVADLASAKFALLELEANLRSIVFSEEWFKYEDSSAKCGSAFHVINPSGASSKLGSVRKKVTCSDAVSHRSSSGPVMFWWRGGILWRQLYSWKVIPRSLISRTARKAGSTKIPGILYPESSELPRRSKAVAWRAAVESSTGIEQLALQVRELHLNIKWDDIEHALFLRKYDKELMKSERAFKKATLRRKCVDGGVVKYLVDFGKRKFLPDIVTKQGTLHEEGSKERKKYWLNEIFVPLHLLKGFEEKKIARKNLTSFLYSGNKTSKRLDLKKNNDGRSGDGVMVTKNSHREKCFSYLFMKAERAQQYQCGHCKKDVSIRDAVSCCCCEGVFHKRHVRKSGEGVAAKCTYTCHKCPIERSGKVIEGAGVGLKLKGSKKSEKAYSKNVKSSVKAGVSTRKSERLVKKLRILKLRRGRRLSGKKKTARKLIVKAAANCRSVSPGLPLRRSARQAANNSSIKVIFPVKKKRKRTRSERNNLKGSKTGLSCKRKRTEACYSYWANGLRLSGSQTDERVAQFKEKNTISSRDAAAKAVKCHLCGERAYQSVTNFISCENCGEWYHGDAFGLDDEKLGQLIGFRCNKCRGKIPSPCPSLVPLTAIAPDH